MKPKASIHDDLSVNSSFSAVLFTFHRFYGIIQLIDKLEFDEGVNDENIIHDWRHDGSGKNNRVPTAKTRFTE